MSRFFIFTFAFASQVLFACDLPANSSWFWPSSKLIQESRFIIRVQAEKEYEQSGKSTYRFMFKEFFKTMVGLNLGGSIEIQGMASSKIEWKRDQRNGRATYSRDCKLWTNFDVGTDYLLFLDASLQPVFHPRSVERLDPKRSNSWLDFVKLESQMHIHLVGTPFEKIQAFEDGVLLSMKKNGTRFSLEENKKQTITEYGEQIFLSYGDLPLHFKDKHSSFEAKLEKKENISHLVLSPPIDKKILLTSSPEAANTRYSLLKK